VDGLWFAWRIKWRIGQRWCMIKQMGNGNYEVQWNVMSWGHGMFGAHEVGGLL
jgi:hypothetical protein